MELVRFLSAVFYGGPDVLHSFCALPDVYGVIPLTFYTAQGREIQDSESTSYYNLAEVEEIVERVSTLVQCWPEEWTEQGASPAQSILVVSPYLDQVIN
jgi:superfamily I DNA and/or RNA helicase